MDRARSFQEAYAPMALLADKVRSRKDPFDPVLAEKQARELRNAEELLGKVEHPVSAPATRKGSAALTDEQARRKLARMEARLLKKAEMRKYRRAIGRPTVSDILS